MTLLASYHPKACITSVLEASGLHVNELPAVTCINEVKIW